MLSMRYNAAAARLRMDTLDLDIGDVTTLRPKVSHQATKLLRIHA